MRQDTKKQPAVSKKKRVNNLPKHLEHINRMAAGIIGFSLIEAPVNLTS